MNDESKPDKHPWTQFTDRVLPPLFVALCVALTGGMWATYKTVDRLAISIESQQRDIEDVRTRIAAVESSLVTKNDMLETMKRVEQQLEIMMLRAGIRPEQPVRLTK